MNEALRTTLRKLRLSGLAQSLDIRLQEAAGHGLNHLEFLELILQDELAVRSDRHMNRRLRQAMLAHRGIEGVRVLQGLMSLTHRHAANAIEKACEIAHSHGAYRLRDVRTLIGRQASIQEQFEFAEEHEIIRSLSEYEQLVHSAFTKENP